MQTYLQRRNNKGEIIKSLIAILFFFGVVFIITAGSFYISKNSNGNERFKETGEKSAWYSIYVDTQTNVLYLRAYKGMTVMLDKDGKPLLYEN